MTEYEKYVVDLAREKEAYLCDTLCKPCPKPYPTCPVSWYNAAHAAQEAIEIPIEIDTMDHSKCRISTGICGCTTAGQGELGENGYWEYPCSVCCQTQHKCLGEQT